MGRAGSATRSDERPTGSTASRRTESAGRRRVHDRLGGRGDYLDVINEIVPNLELPPTADLIVLAEILALETRLSPLARASLQRRLTYGR